MAKINAETRTRIMRAIKGKNTRAEIVLRKALIKSGAKGYRVHNRWVPGTPDISFTRNKLAIFVDGVFWHGDPRKFKDTLSPYWKQRIEKNKARDMRVNSQLQAIGWRVLRFWDLDILSDVNKSLELIRTQLSRR